MTKSILLLFSILSSNKYVSLWQCISVIINLIMAAHVAIFFSQYLIGLLGWWPGRWDCLSLINTGPTMWYFQGKFKVQLSRSVVD